MKLLTLRGVLQVAMHKAVKEALYENGYYIEQRDLDTILANTVKQLIELLQSPCERGTHGTTEL